MKGNITQRGSDSWRIRIYLGMRNDKQQYHESTVRGTRDEAEEELVRLLNSRNQGENIAPEKIRLGAFLKRWLEAAKPNLADSTFDRYEEIVNDSLTPHLGNLLLHKLQPLHVQDMYSELLRNGRKPRPGKALEDNARALSPSTVNHVHRVLHRALKMAVKWQLVTRNVCDAVEAPKVNRKESKFLTDMQLAWLLEGLECSRFYLPAMLAITTGARRGEILAFQWQDLDWQRSTITVNRSVQETKKETVFKLPKTKKSRRTLSLPAMAVEALRQHREQQNAERVAADGLYQDLGLICAREDGSIWSPQCFTPRFIKVATKLGLKIRFHDLRHSHGSALIAAGVHLKTISERLGHTNIATTADIYGHIAHDVQEEAAVKLDGLLRAARDKRNATQPQ